MHLKSTSSARNVQIQYRGYTMKKILLLMCIASLTACASGSGFHFVDTADVNLPVDKYFLSRNFVLVGGSAFSQDIAGLVGRIAYKDVDGAYHFLNQPLLKNNAKPQVKAVQSAYAYSSVIDRGFSTTVNIPFISADATGKTAMSYELRDVAVAGVDPSAEPSLEEFKTAATAASAPADRPWYWIRSAVLADLRQQQSVALNGKTAVTGTGFSANGQVYDNPAASQWVPLISVDAVPMNSEALADARPQPIAPGATLGSDPGNHKVGLPAFVLDRPAHSALVPIKLER